MSTAAAAAPATVRPTDAIVRLSWLIAGLALVAAGAGLLLFGAGAARPFTTVRGETVQLLGHGLYRYDTVFAAGGARGTDAVVLLLGIPLLVGLTRYLRRGTIGGGLLHAGVLLFFLYVYASAALGAVAFNVLFPVYVALFSASLFGFVIAIASIDRRRLAAAISPGVPRRGPAVFLFASGLVTLAVWGLPLLAALLGGGTTDRLDSYTTELTFALDVGVIVPTTVVAGVLILRRSPLGYLLAVPLLTLEAMLAPLIAGQTVSQISAGVSFPPGQIIGPIAGFTVLAVVAAGVVRAILRQVREPGTAGAPASGRPHLWRTWVMWTTAGEALGFLVPAVVAAVTAPYAAAVSLPALLLAGAVEGALLGAAQAHVLRRAVPGFAGRRWAAVTSAAAVVAWSVGLLPSIAGGTLGGWPVPVVVALASVGGLVLLSSIGVAQWTVLRRFVPRAGRWVGFTAVGWLAGLTAFMLVATPLWHEGQPAALTAAIGVLGGIAMAATVAAVTGHGLVSLLRGMPPATRQPRPDRQADPARQADPTRQADPAREADRADQAEPADQLTS